MSLLGERDVALLHTGSCPIRKRLVYWAKAMESGLGHEGFTLAGGNESGSVSSTKVMCLASCGRSVTWRFGVRVTQLSRDKRTYLALGAVEVN